MAGPVEAERESLWGLISDTGMVPSQPKHPPPQFDMPKAPPPGFPVVDTTTDWAVHHGKGKGKGKSKGKDRQLDKGKGEGKVSGAAVKMENKFRDGKNVCMNFNHGKCQDSHCNKGMHVCAGAVGNGRVCGGPHPAIKCTNSKVMKRSNRPPPSEALLAAASAAGSINNKIGTYKERRGAGLCGACGGYYISKTHSSTSSGFCLSKPHICWRAKVVKERALQENRSWHEIFREYREAFESGSAPPVPWNDPQADAQAMYYRRWAEQDPQDEAEDEAEEWHYGANTTYDNVVLKSMTGSSRDAVAADASMRPASGSAPLNASIKGEKIAKNKGIAAMDISESEPEGTHDFLAEQARRTRSPPKNFVLTSEHKKVHRANAAVLDDIAAVITSWAQDARDVAAGNVKRIRESQFPPDLIDSILQSASVFQGHGAHELQKMGASQEDIRKSAEHQASNIVREVAMLARKARKRQEATRMERDRSPTPPMSRSAGTSAKHRRSPPESDNHRHQGTTSSTTA